MDTHEPDTHLTPYWLYGTVWLALVVLTGLTVGAHYANLAHVAIFTAILIATVKASLVLLYFMHVRFENRIIGGMILVTLVIYAVFLFLIFLDYFFR